MNLIFRSRTANNIISKARGDHSPNYNTPTTDSHTQPLNVTNLFYFRKQHLFTSLIHKLTVNINNFSEIDTMDCRINAILVESNIL